MSNYAQGRTVLTIIVTFAKLIFLGVLGVLAWIMLPEDADWTYYALVALVAITWHVMKWHAKSSDKPSS